VRNSADILNDRWRSSLWIVDADGGDHRPLTAGPSDRSPRWSPDGRRLLYAAGQGPGPGERGAVGEPDSVQLFVRWMDSGQTARLTQLQRSPGAMEWSPDGRWIAFTMLVPETPEPLAKMPEKPKGAQWADPPKVIRKLTYRLDGAGYLEDGYVQLFVVPAEGGTARALTSGAFHHDGAPAWTPDGEALLLAANRHPDWELQPLDSEIYEIAVQGGPIRQLTDRRGPDHSPAISPDGRTIAYLGFDDRYQGYQVTRLYVKNRSGGDGRLLSADLDRDVESPVWNADGSALIVSFSEHGNGKVVSVGLDGRVAVLASDLGGGDLGRPYSGGSFTLSPTGRIAYTHTRPQQPPDVAVAGTDGAASRRITRLNEDLFGHKQLGAVEEIWFESSYDRRRIQGWIVKPPGFDPEKSYPLILEIHGGPFADYGDRFAAEIQLYAAAGYVVLYVNPRGSTSYGEEFGNLIHHNYPGQDYDDLMSGVDAVLARGYIDPQNLFVTGGSGGGVLTAWIVGQTDRFRAAVAAKPVINWHSFALTADFYNFFYRYWFSAPPWERPEEYLKRSPLSLVGKVKTPTMLLTGEQDYRTPISESEQFYQALKLRRIDTALVRIPEAPHTIIVRPSLLIAKVSHILAWFEKYRSALRTRREGPPGQLESGIVVGLRESAALFSLRGGLEIQVSHQPVQVIGMDSEQVCGFDIIPAGLLEGT
jgi:acylaminoacyl-peptidase